ncbi:MAG: c-type cytochrome [Betaproteobacteria bacterium]|nr:c-type cytochrome [Betaproteobacteria bacterium]
MAFVAAHAVADDAGQLALTLCSPCHAADGNSVVPMFPKLAGQQPSYIAKQLNDFIAGKRKSDTMAPTLANVKSGDIPALTAHFAAQKQAPGKVENAALATAGRKLFTDGNEATGVPACAGCHLDNGLGNDRYPRIAGQHQAYAIKEMMDFKSGARNNDKGRVMRVVAERLTEEEIKAAAEFMAGM